MAQLGLILVAAGDMTAGFALIDEAMAAALAGEGTALDTVVYTCCDMLNACELASDVARAAQWCAVADTFVERYGCPFLYAECRIFYGSVLTAAGRWDEAEHELDAGPRITGGACPALFDRALVRFAVLRARQGRLEDADELLGRAGGALDARAEEAIAVAAVLLARGDAGAASGLLERRLHELATHGVWLRAALDVLVDAYLAAGDVDRADATARRLADAAATDDLRARATAAWAGLDLPYEPARVRTDLAGALGPSRRDAAVDHARRALATFESLGATRDADRVAALLRSLGVTARVGAKGRGLLTGREQEVLHLVGAGLSNPEIAARLHVSRKTAAHHVSNVLAKLHLRNRAEAAAYAATAGRPVSGC